jgi:hypothetical protein
LNHIPDNIQRGFPILPTPGSLVQFKLLKRWIERCDINHNCKPENVSLPLRLVDVEIQKDRHGCNDPNTLRLDCTLTRKDERYAALTHRWGEPDLHERFCLSHENLERWKDHLDLRMLPRTLQDAVKVARGLGIRYLWIDTLCIIQDDDVDLQAQIRKMEDVFRCAYVTLSATCATGTTDGFFKRQDSQRRHYPLHVANKSGSLGRFYLCDPIDDFKRDVEQSALSRRGWIFQERALSRRIIHFTANQVYWECGTGIRCESLTKLYKWVFENLY